MTMPPLWAQHSPAEVVIYAFAVLGIAVLGGLLVGLLVQLLVRLFSGQRLRGLLLTAVRLLGGACCGLLAYWFLFGPGGGGFGFPGGGGTGSGTGNQGAVS